MNITAVLAIAGEPGLYRLVGQMKNGVIVETIPDGKRIPAYATHKISTLEDISIYTYEGDVPLGEVFEKIHALSGGKEVDIKALGKNIREEFSKALPDFDEDRVYTSDIKKIYKWYNILVNAGLMDEAASGETQKTENDLVEDAEVIEETSNLNEEPSK